MSNTQKAAEPAPIVEDCGLGYCVSDLNRYVAGERAEPPDYAIALVPIPGVPYPLGACYNCIKALQSAPRNGRPQLWAGP